MNSTLNFQFANDSWLREFTNENITQSFNNILYQFCKQWKWSKRKDIDHNQEFYSLQEHFEMRGHETVEAQ